MGYAEDRLDLWQRLKKESPGRGLSDALRLDPRTLRFRLGTSLADVRIPLHVDPRLELVVQRAVWDLFFQLCLRHRSLLREHEYDQLLLLDGFDSKIQRPVSFTPPVTVKSDGVRRAFLEIPELHPALDCGIFAAWIGQNRPGRVLVGALNQLFKRALQESAGSERQEPTAFLTALALRPAAARALGVLKRAPVGQPAGRALHGAVAAGLLCAVRLAAREAGVAAGAGGLFAEAAGLPLPWLGGARAVPGSGATLYGVTFGEMPPRIESLLQRIQQGQPVESLHRELQGEMHTNRESARKAERAGAFARLRGELLSFLRAMETGRAMPFLLEGGLTLTQLHQTPGALERFMADKERRKELQARAKESIKVAASEQTRRLLETLFSAAKEWRDDEPASGWITPTQAHQVYAQATCAYAVDIAFEAVLQQAEGLLVHRQGNERDASWVGEHEAGKLYLFALDDRPILKKRANAPRMGHLFADVKDFTRRTAFLKETVVADFLSHEFYTPILTAAARYHHGAAHLGDRGGIYLNNLLGDAVSFSGDLPALVKLSQDVRAALNAYSRRLDQESTREAVAKTIAAVEERIAHQRAELTEKIKVAQQALTRRTLDPLSGEEPATRLRALHLELRHLEEEREAELSLASGEKLEAGIFISYGAAPEVATFEDSVFGAIKVSIAEKINESARGTARTGAVRTRVEMLIEQARKLRGKPDLVSPFTVMIAQPLSMPVPSEVEETLRQQLARADIDGAEKLLAPSVRKFLQKLDAEQHEASAGAGDIYNGGIALSEEAVRAYMQARSSELLFVRRELSVAQLHSALTDRFAFPMGTLDLVCGFEPTAHTLEELYVHVGRALFKGFEKSGGLGIFEMIAPASPFFGLIARHHAAAWASEASRGSSDDLSKAWDGLRTA